MAITIQTAILENQGLFKRGSDRKKITELILGLLKALGAHKWCLALKNGGIKGSKA
jgi:hypothetical protein